jgi:signal transduction histidine kinase
MTIEDSDYAAGLEATLRATRDGAVVAGRMPRLGCAVGFDDFRPITLREIARDAIDFTRSRWNRPTYGAPNARVINAVEDLGDAPENDGDPVSIREVLFNLIVDAVDALPDGGTLTVRTRRRLGSTAILEVADNGVGIPARVVAHNFTPFFCLREVPKVAG